MSHPSAPRCTRHLDAPAGWACEVCQTRQCVACAAVLRGMPVCGTCGRFPTPLLGPRALVAPISSTWTQGILELANPLAWLWLFLLTCALQFLMSLSSAPRLWFLGRLLMVAWLFFVTRRAGRDLPPFGRPTYDDLFSVWRGPLIRALPVFGPVGLLAAWLVDGGRAASKSTSVLDVLLAILAAPLLAAALPTVTIEGDGRRWALPGPMREVLRVLGGNFRPLLALTSAALVLLVSAGRLEPLAMGDTSMATHIAAMFALTLPLMVVLTALGMVAGRLLVTFAAELGHDSGEHHLLPWLTALPTREWAPPEAPESQLAAQRAERFRPIELEPAAGLLERALKEERLDDALALLQRGEVSPSALAGEPLITLAQALAARGELRRAADLLESLLARPEDPALPRGQVILARLLGERLGQPERATRLLEEVVLRFPGTKAATFASERLRLIPPG